MPEGPPIGAGKNGEVYPCPECGKHESVRWLPGNTYRYHCDDCDRTYTKRDAVSAYERGDSGDD